MSFRIRLLLRLLLWLLKPALDITQEYRGEYRIWVTEAELRVVEYYRYGYMLVLERFRIIFSTGLWKTIFKRNWTAVTGAQICKIKRPLKRWQRFTIITKAPCWDEKWIYLEQRIESSGKLICSAVSSVMFLAKNRKIPPSEVIGLLGMAYVSPPLSDSVRKFRDAEQALSE